MGRTGQPQTSNDHGLDVIREDDEPPGGESVNGEGERTSRDELAGEKGGKNETVEKGRDEAGEMVSTHTGLTKSDVDLLSE